MASARDLMSSPAQTLTTGQSLVDAARALASNNVGSMPVLGDDGQLAGIVTDRDIVVRGLAEGVDPSTGTVGDVLSSSVVVVNADDDDKAVVNALSLNQVRRLPVIDGQEVVGVVSQADVARHLSNEQTGDVVQKISE